ncbi:hypothetical protein GGX14DRAFT_578618 [Mycena pura]|uniref:DUF6533 domain-containing protein n=1 Tax=Mycena pura TaxID=153505 RepID=A0AAD6XZE3_9AGAR|nr:hypothetical protein GGX14DRAFT_578618 [Mycena pura]
MSAASLAQEEEEFVAALQLFTGLRYFVSVPFITLVFDHLVTIDQEVTMIWTNPTVRWHSKLAFFINRYLPPAIISYVVYTQLTFFEPLRTCQFGPTPRVLTGMMCVTSLFDFALVALVLFNAIDRPRRTNIELISALENDGAGLFVTIFALRFSEVFISLYRPTAEVFVAVTTVWALCTMINSRFHMRLEGLALATARGAVIMLEDM